MDTSKTLWRGSVFGILAAVFAVVAMILSPIAGLAAGTDDEVTDDTGPALGNIVDQARSLTVHKHKDQVTEAEANGHLVEGLVDPLEGVEFSVTEVDLDLAVPANWEKISELTFVDGKVMHEGTEVPLKEATATTKTTNDSGVAKFEGLNQAVYLVRETGFGSHVITQKAAPFFVVLPMPDGENWLYDVHVYPKNTVTTVEKTLDDDNAHSQQDWVYWDVKVNIPAGSPLAKLEISDTFDPRLTDFAVESVMIGTTPVTSGYSENTVGQTVTVTFDEDGRQAIANEAADADKILTVRFKAKVGSLGDDGVIPNEANVLINESDATVESDSTQWGQLKVFKYEGADAESGVALEGAVFKVYLDEGATQEVEGVVLTTDSNGNAVVTLKVGDYWVKEITAPAGYKLLEGTMKVTVSANGTTGVPFGLDVANEKIDGPDLPVTGASGQLLMTVGGLAILLMASGALFVGIKRRSDIQ